MTHIRDFCRTPPIDYESLSPRVMIIPGTIVEIIYAEVESVTKALFQTILSEPLRTPNIVRGTPIHDGYSKLSMNFPFRISRPC